MANQNQLTAYAFLMNTAYNMWTDESNDSFIQKLGRAALNSVPITLAIDTKDIVNFAANKMGLNNISQPKTTYHSMKNVISGSAKTLEQYVQDRNMPAYYSKLETLYKNFE